MASLSPKLSTTDVLHPFTGDAILLQLVAQRLSNVDTLCLAATDKAARGALFSTMHGVLPWWLGDDAPFHARVLLLDLDSRPSADLATAQRLFALLLKQAEDKTSHGRQVALRLLPCAAARGRNDLLAPLLTALVPFLPGPIEADVMPRLEDAVINAAEGGHARPLATLFGHLEQRVDRLRAASATAAHTLAAWRDDLVASALRFAILQGRGMALLHPVFARTSPYARGDGRLFVADAAACGAADVLAAYAEQPFGATASTMRRGSVLCIAARHGHAEVLRVLTCVYGFMPVDEQANRQALASAVQHGHAEALRVLLAPRREGGIGLWDTDVDRWWHLLRLAVASGSAEVLAILGEPMPPEARGSFSFNQAAWLPTKGLGSAIGCCEHLYRNAMWRAVLKGKADVLRQLAQPPFLMDKANAEAPIKVCINNEWKTCRSRNDPASLLHVAALRGDAEVARVLIDDYHVSAEHARKRDGAALRDAIRLGHAEVAKLLLQRFGLNSTSRKNELELLRFAKSSSAAVRRAFAEVIGVSLPDGPAAPLARLSPHTDMYCAAVSHASIE